MFENLTERLDKFVRNLRGQGRISDDNIRETVREVRRILLDADVSLPAAKAFVEGVHKKALGRDVAKSITPGQLMVKIIHDELAAFLGGESAPVRFGKSPSALLVAGLNGSGKTTTAAKLALWIKKHGRRPLLVAADTFRPAAINQLEILAKQIDVPFFAGDRKNPVSIVQSARELARDKGFDSLVIDTAGRMHINDELMDELKRMHAAAKPSETLLVVDGMTGQDAVRSAKAFTEAIEITGLILTKLDGDARGGAALSIRWVTGRPIKFIGVGEKVGDFEPFHPERMAGRILGMGDVVALVEKVQSLTDAEQARRNAEKLVKRQFNLEDFRDQLDQISKLGPLDALLGMIPGMRGALKGLQVDNSQIKVLRSIIDSMTIHERRSPRLINGSRRRRIALGSGRSVQEVNRLLNQFEQMQGLFKRFGKGGKNFPGGLPGLPKF